MSAWGNYQRDVRLIDDLNGMKDGPYYDAKRGELRIPSYIFNARAITEWKRRGLRYDASMQQWYCPIPQAHALEQVERARKVYFTFWTF